MDIIRQTVTLQISVPADDGEPSGWNFADLFDISGDMVQVLNSTEAEELTANENEEDCLIVCKECGYILRRDETDNWIDFTDGDVCHDDVQHVPMDY